MNVSLAENLAMLCEISIQGWKSSYPVWFDFYTNRFYIDLNEIRLRLCRFERCKIQPNHFTRTIHSCQLAGILSIRRDTLSKYCVQRQISTPTKRWKSGQCWSRSSLVQAIVIISAKSNSRHVASQPFDLREIFRFVPNQCQLTFKLPFLD